MLRPILFLHRWLGMIVGLVMTVWCLSGFVMMYADYPRLLPAEQLRGLAPLQLPARDAWARIALPDDRAIASAKIEMMAGRPVLRIGPGTFDLATGQAVVAVTRTEAEAIARTFAERSGDPAPVRSIAATGIDQWAVQIFKRNAPLYRADLADVAGTQLYVSGKSGEVVQQTTRFERFWGWLGAVPHWLYPTILRQYGALWSQVVIWTSLLGCFLTITGIWTGVARLRRRRKDGKLASPYGGIWWWHHVFGLWFGLLTLTWVASGLFSMNPWGFLDSMAGFAERERLAGAPRWAQVRAALAALPELPGDTVRLEGAPLGGRMFFTAQDAAGHAVRFSPDGRKAPLREAELRQALANGPPLRELVLLGREDDYYYAHKVPAPLPVWRAVLGDGESTRLYIDPTSGQILRAVDTNGRRFRWLQDGLHSLDLPVLRQRPLWDLVVLLLLAMVTLICATGTWMGWKKIARDLRRMRRKRQR